MGARTRELLAVVPRGGALSDRAWTARHHIICVLLWLHAAVLPLVGTVRGDGLLHSLQESALVAALAVGATLRRFSPATRSLLATLGLLVSSTALVHFFDGLIEMHFHFFVMIAVVALYQAWRPYLLAVGFVMLHHAVAGTLAPELVYNHPAAITHPEAFAALHGSFILAESIACLMFWKANENAFDAERAQRARVELSNAALSEANREISDLVAMLSHDLRTPLSVVNGYAEMALDAWDTMTDDERLELVRRIEQSGRALQEMLDDTLTVSALDADGLTPRVGPVRVDEELRDLLTALGDPLPGVDLTGVEPVTARVDRGHLSQVLTNLVTNAAKYGAAPYAVTTGRTGDTVVLTVTDRGPGVSERFAARLFDRYTRSDEARSGEQKGTGLGLFIARSLLEANGGTICHERPAGGGASFVVSLPVHDELTSGAPAPSRPDAARTPGAAAGPEARPAPRG